MNRSARRKNSGDHAQLNRAHLAKPLVLTVRKLRLFHSIILPDFSIILSTIRSSIDGLLCINIWMMPQESQSKPILIHLKIYSLLLNVPVFNADMRHGLPVLKNSRPKRSRPIYSRFPVKYIFGCCQQFSWGLRSKLQCEHFKIRLERWFS